VTPPQPPPRWATEDDATGIAELLSTVFAPEYAPALSRDDLTRRRALQALLDADFIDWRGKTLIVECEARVAGLAILTWPDERRKRRVGECLRQLVRIMGPLEGLLGLIAFVIVPPPRPLPGGCEIDTLGVHPDFRRRGIARALLGAAQAEAVRRGASHLSLDVMTDNAAAVRLYESDGFAVTARRVLWSSLLGFRWATYYRMVKQVG
jgi:ribosomal protein S18 acetylase RimI-like enzyme